MLLAIDAGNSDIVFGLFDGRNWVHIWRVPTRDGGSPEAWLFRLAAELLELELEPGAIERAVISSVVPPLNQGLLEMAARLTEKPPLILGPDTYPKLKIRVRNPQEIGSDLVANAVAAYEMHQSHCIVVDFGTALTFTTLSDTGEILGVAIAPGLKTAIRSLFENTAQLPEVPLEVPSSALGKDTIHAIQAGITLGYTGMVSYLLDHIKSEIGNDCPVIATGGLSSVLTSLRSHFTGIDPLLTLKGLAIIDRQLEGLF